MSDLSTPIPWTLDGNYIWHFGLGYSSVTDPHRSTGIEIAKEFRDSPIAIANARLSVKAVNSYAALVEALEAMVNSKWQCPHCQLPMREINHPSWCPVNKARAALALARGEKAVKS